ncbi:MAG: GNAT family N-acetyltransferase [Pseudomonadota bacterium]
MSMTFTIPTIETERMILRAPRIEDAPIFRAFYRSERSQFVGGPHEDESDLNRAFGSIAGLWMLRGHSLLIGELKSAPGVAIGAFGTYEPLHWPEPELGWALYDAKYEGKGYVTEALRAIMPWAWDRVGTDTFVSFIDEGNEASVRVAKALGAVFDSETTAAVNAPGAIFHDPDDVDVHVYRHRKEAA